MHKINIEKHTQTQDNLSRFGPLDLHSVPKHPLEIFLNLILKTIKTNKLYTT